MSLKSFLSEIRLTSSDIHSIFLHINIYIYIFTLQGTNISPCKGTLHNDFPFPHAGYISFLEGIFICLYTFIDLLLFKQNGIFNHITW